VPLDLRGVRTWERRSASRRGPSSLPPTSLGEVRTILRDWMEAHHPMLVGLWDWPRYRLFGRCFVCGRLIVLHSPWRLFICERTPLPIEITEKGRERIESEVVPVSHAHIA
jgi:hypothetical protein